MQTCNFLKHLESESVDKLTAHWSCEWKWRTVWMQLLWLERLFWPTALCVCVELQLLCWSQEQGWTLMHEGLSVEIKRKTFHHCCCCCCCCNIQVNPHFVCVCACAADVSSYLCSFIHLLPFSFVSEILKREKIQTCRRSLDVTNL